MSESESVQVLYMEDNAATARLVQRRLGRAGHRVDVARDGEEGLAMHAAGRYDVLVVDHCLPVHSGLEVIQTLVSQGTLPPTIMVTGSGSERLAVEAMKLGAADYIVEDVGGGFLDLLPAVIEHVLEQREPEEEQQAAQEALRQSELEYRTLASNIPGMVYRARSDWSTEIVSKSEEICGYLIEELNSEEVNWLDIIHPDDKERVIEGGSQLLEEPMALTQEYRIIAEDGSTRWVSDRKTSCFAGEVFQGVGGVVFDITDRVRAEQELRASEKRFRDVAMSTSDWVWELDGEDRYTYCSEGLVDVLGYPADEVLGRTPYDLMLPEEGTRVRKIFEEIARSREPIVDLESWSTDHEGRQVCLLTNGVPVFDNQGNYRGYRGVAKDVTQRVRAEEQTKASLHEKEVLLREIHHRVKNNLQIVSSLLYLQAKKIKEQQLLEICQDSQNRVKSMALIHETLSQSQNLARIDIGAYIGNLSNHLVRTYAVSSRAINLQVNIGDVSLGVDTAVSCGLIVNELVSNALKHAFPGRSGPAGEIRIDLDGDEEHGYTLVVSDNGVGFPPDLDLTNGDSLGFQLVSNLVRQLDGAIEVRREGGAEFRVTFAEPGQRQTG